MAKTVTLSEKRVQKLYGDVTDTVMDTRILIARLWPQMNGDQLQKLLMDLQLKVADRAIKSLEEPL